jgi:iron(III) transport system ATP-binding protein
VLYREPATEMVARFVGHGMVVPVEIIGREGPRMLVDLWGVRIAVRGEGNAGEHRSLCLHAENLVLTSMTTGAIQGRVVASAYQGAATVLTIQPNAADAPQLRVEYASAPPAVGAAVAVAVRDGFVIRNVA